MARAMQALRELTVLLFASGLLAGCSSAAQLTVESLDTGTGATIMRATVPLILYSDNSAYAAHARDFVYMGPIEVNRMGRRDHYLWLGIWSTIRDDERLAPDRDGFESVVLFVDGEPFPLELAGWTLDTIGVSQSLYVKPVASAADAYYHITLDQVRRLAAAEHIDLRIGTSRPRAYVLWDRQGTARSALQEFGRRGYD